MHTAEKDLPNLPEDNASLKAMLRSLLAERDREKQRAEEERKRADDLHIQNLRFATRVGTVQEVVLRTTSRPAEFDERVGTSAAGFRPGARATTDSSGGCSPCERAGVRIAASETA